MTAFACNKKLFYSFATPRKVCVAERQAFGFENEIYDLQTR